MRGIMLGIALIGGMLVAGAAPTFADPPSLGRGPAFGQHVSGMALEHATDHRAMFGECVSTMAQAESCDHPS